MSTTEVSRLRARRGGIILGRDRAGYLALGGQESVALYAPPRSGKTSGVAIPNAMARVLGEMGVDVRLSEPVEEMLFEGRRATGVRTAQGTYDADAEHNRIRRELFAPISASIERIQFRLPG